MSPWHAVYWRMRLCGNVFSRSGRLRSLQKTFAVADFKDKGVVRVNAKEEFKIVERLFFFALLMFVGGFYGGYTYSLRGKVFANAQTANLVMMMLSFGNGDWKRGLYSFVPLTAYICGVCFAELLGERLNRKNQLVFERILLLCEAFISLLIGFMPAAVPDRIPQVMLSFICAMQFTVFKKAEGLSMATTFCTNHIRQMGVNLVKGIRDNDDNAFFVSRSHGFMLLSFCAGAFVAVSTSHVFGYYCIWITVAVHLFLFYITHKESMKEI